MKQSKNFLSYLMLTLSAFGLVFLSACGEDEVPAAPVVTLTADGLVDGQITGNIGDEVTIAIATEAAGGFASMTITQYQGADEIASDEYTTEQTSFSHTITEADFQNPFRVNVEVTDNEAQMGSADAIISVEASAFNKLVAFSWLFSDQMWEGTQTILDCEKDNVYTFNADGTVSYDYGALTGSGGGSCDFDGFDTRDGWMISDDETMIEIYRGDAFTGEPKDTIFWTVQEFNDQDFTVLWPTIFGDITEVYTAVPKAE